MMHESLQAVLDVLKQKKEYFADNGVFLQNVVYDAAMKMDVQLIRLLLSNNYTKKRFFANVDGTLVFDKVGFGWVINNTDFLPNSYTRFKNKIGLANSKGEMISSSNDVVLVFPYKECVLEGGQTKDDQKRDEIFYNETLAPDEVDRLLAPKVFSNAKRYSQKGTEIVKEIEDSDSLIIKGNNLLVISSVLERYEKLVKCVYIDPPYNPESNANTFCYNNTFNRSTWLVFMKTRLEITKKLLTDDGVLVVAIDKNEQPYLQILIEEIFSGYDVDCITIVHNPRGTIGTNFSYTHEYALFVTPKGKKCICNRKLDKTEIDWSPLRNWGGESLRSDAKNCFYAIIVKDDTIVGFGDAILDDTFHPSAQTVKQGDKYLIYPIDTKGIERKWRYARQTVESIIDLLRVKKTKTGYDIEIGKDFGLYKTVWTDSKYDASVNGTQLLNSIIPDCTFTYPKSLYNVKECIQSIVGEDKNSIVLDFFGGSGTTAHAVLEINKEDGGHRKFILVEQMDYAESVTVVRVEKILKSTKSDSSFVFCELAKLNERFIERIQNAITDEDFNKIFNEMKKTAFISSYVDPGDVENNIDGFNELAMENKKLFLLQILDKNLLNVNLSDIDDNDYAISDVDKAFTKSFYRM